MSKFYSDLIDQHMQSLAIRIATELRNAEPGMPSPSEEDLLEILQGVNAQDLLVEHLFDEFGFDANAEPTHEPTPDLTAGDGSSVDFNNLYTLYSGDYGD